MAEHTKSLLEQPSGGALAEGAARFEQLIRSVKSQQLQIDSSPAPAPTNPLLSVSPQEEWSRQFRNEDIGPVRRSLDLSELAPLPRAMIMPEPEFEPAGSRTTRVVDAPSLSGIGAGLGKSERPSRSWLGRILQRS